MLDPLDLIAPPPLPPQMVLLDFSATREGLEDALLGTVVAAGRPQLQQDKARLLLAGAAARRRLAEAEDALLGALGSCSGTLLEDGAAAAAVTSALLRVEDAAAEQRVTDEAEAEVDAARLGGRALALRMRHGLSQRPVASPLLSCDMMPGVAMRASACACVRTALSSRCRARRPPLCRLPARCAHGQPALLGRV